MADRSFQSFGEENVGEFTIANISYFSESGIWLGKMLANDVRFAKLAKVFPCQNFALYSTNKIPSNRAVTGYMVIFTGFIFCGW